MGALTFDALLRSLKQGAPDPVYYLHGEEDVLKDEAVRVLLERAVDPAARDFNVDQRTAADLDPEAFNALVNTPPILAATRAVVLRGMEQLRKTAKVRQELLHYLDSPNPSTVLVLVHGTPEPPDAELLRRATAVEVAALPPERIVRWMTHRAKQLGFTLAPEAEELLLASVGNDLSGLARELEKLAPPDRATVRPGELGADRAPLGPLGGALDQARAAQRPASGLGRRSRSQVEHVDRRSRHSGATGAVVERAGEGGGVTGGRRLVLAAALLMAGPLLHLSAQTDTVRVAALRVAQTRPDSARAMVRRLLARLSPQASIYPGVLFTAGGIAADATTAATNLQRVVVEYGRSAWADSALVLLTQLYFAQGDPAATVQAAERLRLDYPDSSLRPRADFWGARAYFDLKDDAHGCSLIREALDGAGADVEFKNQVTFYASRCASTTPAPPVTAPATAGDTQAKPASPAATYAVQVLAVKSAAQVDEMLTRLKVMGFDARVVRDTSGLFKVRVGRYASHDEAAQAQRRLKTRLGGQPFVVEEP